MYHFSSRALASWGKKKKGSHVVWRCCFYGNNILTWHRSNHCVIGYLKRSNNDISAFLKVHRFSSRSTWVLEAQKWWNAQKKRRRLQHFFSRWPPSREYALSALGTTDKRCYVDTCPKEWETIQGVLLWEKKNSYTSMSGTVLFLLYHTLYFLFICSYI